MVLVVPTSSTQAMSREVLETLMVLKLERLITAAQESGEPVSQILEIHPDLAMAAKLEATPRAMAEAMLWAESLSSLMSRASMTGKPSDTKEVLSALQGQTLRSLAESLASAEMA